MENVKRSVNELISELVEPFNLLHIREILKKIQGDDTYLFKNYREDIVSEVLLLKWIKKSILSKKLQQIMPDVLYLIDSSSVTDRVLNFCIHYPGRFRKTLLIQLAHMWLTTKQLEVINREIDTPEAFCKLFLLYAENENYTVDQFATFLRENFRRLMEVDCIKMIDIHQIRISQSKRRMVEYAVNKKVERE